MEIRDIMTTRVVSVEMDERLRQVKEIFDAVKFRHLLVVGGDKRLQGVVSDRDLLKAISPFIGSLAETTRDAATLNKRVHQIMARNPVTIGPNATIADAVALFRVHRISCLPVVDANFRAVAIVSLRDLLKTFPA
jgi:acetoin utilization protein AcuB